MLKGYHRCKALGLLGGSGAQVEISWYEIANRKSYFIHPHEDFPKGTSGSSEKAALLENARRILGLSMVDEKLLMFQALSQVPEETLSR